MHSGIYLINKQSGQSSFDVIRQLKREMTSFNTNKNRITFGHGGTLDPFAEGLIIVLAGQATRLTQLIHCLPKIYLAKISWGTETDTCDYSGNVIAHGSLATISDDILKKFLKNFIGWKQQTPPDTCAKKINGKPAYIMAHQGNKINIKSYSVYLHTAHWVHHNLPKTSTLHIICNSGYYVRSLIRDIGQITGYRAHLSALIRTQIGPWRNPPSGFHFINGNKILPWCNYTLLNTNHLNNIKYGKPILNDNIYEAKWKTPKDFPFQNTYIAGIHNNKLVTILQKKNNNLWPNINFHNGI